MEALWNLVDKWNLSTKQAILVFFCTAALVIVLCFVMALSVKRARKNRLVNHDPGLAHIELAGPIRAEPRAARWGSVKKVLMGSVRWSSASKWEESRNCASRREKVKPLLAREGVGEGGVGWRSRRDMVAPVWQRPILMGEKCELPRFSGLILYDERGRPLDDHSLKGTTPSHQDQVHNSMVIC